MIEERLHDIIALAEIEETPFYCVDLDRIREAARHANAAWKSAFPLGSVAYSYKTNSVKSITKIMKDEGLMAEVVSGPELEWALCDGFAANEILFDGPYKSELELRFAIEADARVQFDSICELHQLLDIATTTSTRPRIAPRMATAIEGGGLSRFGLSTAEYRYSAKIAGRHGISFSGIHVHVGSNNRSTEPYLAALNSHKKLIKELIKRTLHSRPLIDIGGGLPASSVSEEGVPFRLEQLADDIMKFLSREDINPDDIFLVVEPGRSLTEDFGVLVTRVVALKKRAGKTLVIVDAGTNFLRSISTRYHPVALLSGELAASRARNYELYGSQCFERDAFGNLNASGSDVRTGDLIIFGNCGGYDIANSGTWIRSSPAIFGFEGDRYTLLRRTKTPSEMRFNDL